MSWFMLQVPWDGVDIWYVHIMNVMVSPWQSNLLQMIVYLFVVSN